MVNIFTIFMRDILELYVGVMYLTDIYFQDKVTIGNKQQSCSPHFWKNKTPAKAFTPPAE